LVRVRKFSFLCFVPLRGYQLLFQVHTVNADSGRGMDCEK
jgi:hypothetical protein